MYRSVNFANLTRNPKRIPFLFLTYVMKYLSLENASKKESYTISVFYYL